MNPGDLVRPGPRWNRVQIINDFAEDKQDTLSWMPADRTAIVLQMSSYRDWPIVKLLTEMGVGWAFASHLEVVP